MAEAYTAGQASDNSRGSVAGAGWHCPARDLAALLSEERRAMPAFRWFNVGTLLESRNDRLARWFGDPSAEQRELWLDDWYGDARPDLRLDRTDLSELSFVLVGDTGEGDTSQAAVLPVLEQVGRGTDFMVICSDVIYPAGEVEEYEHKFFHPYREYPSPIYGLPGTTTGMTT